MSPNTTSNHSGGGARYDLQCTGPAESPNVHTWSDAAQNKSMQLLGKAKQKWSARSSLAQPLALTDGSPKSFDVSPKAISDKSS